MNDDVMEPTRAGHPAEQAIAMEQTRMTQSSTTAPSAGRLAIVLAIALLATTLSAAAPGAALAQDGLKPRKCVQQQPYYFHGMPPDEATFSQDPPDAVTPAVQPAGFVWLNPAIPPQTFVAVWSADFAEALCGPAVVTVHMALPTLSTVHVSAFDGGSVLGVKQEYFHFGAVPDDAVTLSIPLAKGTIASLGWRVRIFGSPYGSAGAVFYDHAAYPSSFTISVFEPCDAVDEHPDCYRA